MPYTYEDKTFTIEITVSARAHIETGGSSGHDSDEPPWEIVNEVEVDYVDILGQRLIGAHGIYDAIISAAKGEFE